jgi:NAD(P)-dependent dehydrogenase (short-subunit alcohol dehydrogenase family)
LCLFFSIKNAYGIALIIGAAQGIGCVIVFRLAKDGFNVAINDIDKKNLS